MNQIPPPAGYTAVVLFLLFAAAGIKRSRIIDFLGEKILEFNSERTSTMMLISLTYVLSPFFLSFVFLSNFSKWSVRIDSNRKVLTLLIISTLMGSIILPFGNLRNIYINLFLGMGEPGINISQFVLTMIPLWTAGLVILLTIAYFLLDDRTIKQRKTDEKWRWKELVFSLILYAFIFAYFNTGGRVNLNILGFLFLAGAFSFAFMGIETLKEVNWWVFIPVGISFIVYFLLGYGEWSIGAFPGFLGGSILSGIFSSNITAFFIPFIEVKSGFMLYAAAAGSIAGIFGSYETIFYWIKDRKAFNLKLILEIYGIFLVIALVILLITGG